ncbi:reverse transcriptase domain-containing protein [Tanacetum coccineum]
MAKEDEEKTAFITSQGIFCYSKMPFGLKNAGATCQRLVDKAFQKQIGRNLEVYVDDLVIKSRTEQEVIRDIKETFKTLREINMKLNPKKCTFGMRECMFLRYKVNDDGLKVCPDKVEAVLSLPSPKCLKDVQRLNGKLASLNRFMSKSAKKSLPFFKTLKKCTKKNDFQWTAKLPMLTEPKEKEELLIYLTAAKESISAVLMTEKDGKQVPIYFVSRALQGPKINYTPIEKLKLALEDCSNGALSYKNMTSTIDQEHGSSCIDDEEELPDLWILFTNGSSCIDGSGADLILTNPEGMEFTYALRFRFDATNNEAEYEALIAGLRIVEQMGVKNIQANVDSRLMANQVNIIYIAKEQGMIKYLKKELKEKSIDEKEVLTVVKEEGRTWMTPIHEYLMKEILPEEKRKARTKRRKAGRYAVTNGILYKNSFLRPWLRCVAPLQVNYVLREIHEGSCSMHACPRSVVAKALRSRYYWPTMHADGRKLIRECNSFQVHRPVPRNPQQNLTPITSPWPFYKWGIDIVRPFLEGPGKVKFLIVAIDYFTKWIEAKPIATITGAKIKKFMWDNIVYRFGLPGEIIFDNDKQFRDNLFKDWCEKLCIRQCFASVKHPQANGLVERANRSLGEGIKARPSGRDKRTCSNPGSKKAKLRWNNTTMLEFTIQVSIQETSSTKTMKRAMQKMEASSDLSGKDHMRSQMH